MADEEKKEKQDEQIIEKVKTLVESKLTQLTKSDIQANNVDYFSKLVDIHKDIENESYWKTKKEAMEMRYSNYNDGGYSDGYSDGGYSDGGYGNYGRRGVPGSGRGRGRARDSRGRYAGPGDMIDKMHEHYSDYAESSEAYGRGNYSAKGDTMKSLEYMLESVCQFLDMLEQDATSQEEMQLIKKYAKKIGER